MALSEMSMVKTSFLRCFRKESTDIAVLFVFHLAPSSPPNVTAVAHNSTTISVAWQPVPKKKRNGKIIGYWLIIDATNSSIRQLLSRSEAKNFSDALEKHPNGTIIACWLILDDDYGHVCGAYIKVDDGKEDKAQNDTFTGLRKFTPYWVHVGARTSAGYSIPNGSIEVTTGEAGR